MNRDKEVKQLFFYTMDNLSTMRLRDYRDILNLRSFQSNAIVQSIMPDHGFKGKQVQGEFIQEKLPSLRPLSDHMATKPLRDKQDPVLLGLGETLGGKENCACVRFGKGALSKGAGCEHIRSLKGSYLVRS